MGTWRTPCNCRPVRGFALKSLRLIRACISSVGSRGRPSGRSPRISMIFWDVANLICYRRHGFFRGNDLGNWRPRKGTLRRRGWAHGIGSAEGFLCAVDPEGLYEEPEVSSHLPMRCWHDGRIPCRRTTPNCASACWVSCVGLPRFLDQESVRAWRGSRQGSLRCAGVVCIALVSWFEWRRNGNRRRR